MSEHNQAETIGRFRRDGGEVTNIADVLHRLDRSHDQFDQLIADGRTNEGDIAAHFDYTPERWRVDYDAGSTGTWDRRFIQYGDAANHTDGEDSQTLAPADGDTMRLRTAERFRYVVQYSIVPSWAFQLNQGLGAGDKATIAYGTSDLGAGMAAAEGIVIELVPELDDDQCYFAEWRNGSIRSFGDSGAGTRKTVKLNEAITRWLRYALPFNWYNVGSSGIEQTTTKDGVQTNEIVGRISADGQKGSISGNHRMEFALQSGGNGTEMEVGSAGVVTLGDVNELFRPKGFERIGDDSIANTDVWEPVLAMRIDPDRANVAVQLNELRLLNFTGSGSIRLQAQGFDPSKLSFGGGDSWSAPNQLSATSSVIQTRTDVTGYPDSSGSEVTSADTWTNDPGGFQVNRSVLSVSGTGSQQSVSRKGATRKNPIYDLDTIVLLANGDVTGTLDYTVDLEEDW